MSISLKDFKKEGLCLLVIFIAAFVLRVIYISTLSNHELYFADGMEFDSIAKNLAAGNGYSGSDGTPTAGREPVYPIFLAAIYKIAGHDLLVVRICQAFLGALTCIIIYFIGKKISSIRVGICSSIIASIYPFFIYYNGHILSETLFIFLFLVAMLLLLNIQEAGWVSKPVIGRTGVSPVKCIIAGILLGVGVLCRSLLLVSIPFFIIGLFLVTKRRLYFLKCASLIIIAFFLTITPWVYRNHLLFGKAVVRLGGFENLWFGNNPYFGGDFDKECAYMEEIKKVLNELPPSEQVNLAISEAVKYMKDNPGRFLRNTGIKFIRFWRFYPRPTPLLNMLTGVSGMKTKLISILSDGTIISLGIVGLLVSLRDWRKYLLIYIWIVSQTSVFLIAYPLIRYRLPLMPFVIVFAGLAVVEIIKRRLGKCLA